TNPVWNLNSLSYQSGAVCAGQGRGEGDLQQSAAGDADGLLPLPPGEGRGEGGLQLKTAGDANGGSFNRTTHPHPNPLPEGEGTIATSPHPNPLPEAEGTKPVLANAKCLPTAELSRIGREIALGLAAAHARGLIHRDIKPSNVWLEADTGRVKILDFGLARVTDGEEQLTHSGSVLGTPAYMSPEQASGCPADARSDLFSLGCILYHGATGRRPFSAAQRCPAVPQPKTLKTQTWGGPPARLPCQSTSQNRKS
ncbi:MAG TPA: serine/threonine-protein kinase, partial [Pirellulales bacterium]